MRITATTIALLVTAATATSASAAPAPPAPQKPVAQTGAATQVSVSGATLNASVNPRGSPTRVRFIWGNTRKYGRGTDFTMLPGDRSGHVVSARIEGLAPRQTYHFRVEATNGVGQSLGGDRTVKTPGDPNALALGASPNPVVFGHATVITGRLTGPNAVGVGMTLEGRPAPFTAPFAALGPGGTTDASGAFSISYLSPGSADLRVVAATPGATASAPIRLGVTLKVTLRATHRVRRGKRARLAGLVKPTGGDGTVLIQRRGRAGWQTVSRTSLQSASGGTFRYAAHVRVLRGAVYRAVVGGDATYVAGHSAARRIRAA